MSDKDKLTLNISPETHERLREISNDLGVTVTDYQRRLIGLGSIIHSLIEESSDGQVFIMIRTDDGSLENRHIINELQF